jgi:diadenosine tetraphosphate (Ap4A) HIT family hydrolase
MSNEDVPGCLACDLTRGRHDLPGGRVHATEGWVVEHCIGPLGVGTLIVKPVRHCLHVWELTEREAAELGPLLRKVNIAVRNLLSPDQVYVCLWSHAGWEPVHIHFVVQPVWNAMREQHEHPGPCLQRDMFHSGVLPPRNEVEVFAERARQALRTGA